MIKENEFIEIEYTGKTKDDIIFDTTDEKVAKEEGIAQPNASYGPAIICVGQGQIIGGLDKKILDKEIGKEYTIELQPEEAFGKKSAKLIQLVPTRKFKENEIMPQPGLQVEIDNLTGIIKTVSGGRTLVDFNHPLSGKIIDYKIKILRKVEDDKEKLLGYLKLILGMKDINVDIKEGKATVTTKMEFPKEATDELAKKIKEVIPSIKDIEFKKEEKPVEKAKEKPKEEKKEANQEEKTTPK